MNLSTPECFFIGLLIGALAAIVLRIFMGPR
jgi:hypothetical protein